MHVLIFNIYLPTGLVERKMISTCKSNILGSNPLDTQVFLYDIIVVMCVKEISFPYSLDYRLY